MKKVIYILAFLVLGTVSAQDFARQSLEMGIGGQMYSDKLGDSNVGLSVQTSYRYMFTPTFGLQGAWQFDVTTKDDTDPLCDYRAVSHHFRAEIFKRIARFGRFTVNGSTGVGASFYYLEQDARERVFNYTAAGSVFYSVGDKKNPWGFVKAEYRGIGNSAQDYTLNREFETTSTPIQAFRQVVSVGFGIYLDNAQNKTHADYYKKKRRNYVIKASDPVIEYRCCDQKQDTTAVEKDLPYWTVFFREGDSRIQDAYLPEIYKAVEFAKNNPEYNLVVSVGSCTNQGSDEANRRHRKNRAMAIFNKLVKMGLARKNIIVIWEENQTQYDGTNSDIQKIGLITPVKRK